MTAQVVYLCPLINGTTQLLANGALNQNGNVSVYLGGTNTLANSCNSAAGTTNNPNPIQINTKGVVSSQIWLPAGQNTKIVITSANGAIQDTEDSLIGIDDPTYANAESSAAYNLANSAYSVALAANSNSTVLLANVSAAYNAANAAANTVAVYANGTLVLASAQLNFNNSSTMNANISVAGISGNLTLPTVNVGYDINLVTLGLANNSGVNVSNGWSNVTSNIEVQFGSLTIPSTASPPAGGTTYNVIFPRPFYSTCYTVAMSITSTGLPDAQEGIPKLYGTPTATGFSIVFDAFNDAAGFASTTLYWIAIGNTGP